MGIQVINHFSFRQANLVSTRSQGLCMGISLALVSHLQDIGGPKISPVSAFDMARRYMHAMENTVAGDRIAPGCGQFVVDLGVVHNNHQGLHRVPGVFAGKVPKAGLGLMYLRLQDVAWWDTVVTGSPNHIGVCAWNRTHGFILDPNYGGLLFAWSRAPSGGHRRIFNEALQQLALFLGAESWPARPVLIYLQTRIAVPFPSTLPPAQFPIA